ncbi:taste receptor type 2 member 40-like [Polyodon spathula]|uniref:taste receptor type 2 member 40-like n=1 Tax=Polyodon spathula TaxID=7913 RepID=UPI001B7F2B41|nr:taste receptor type 2 member 40-like [Polyodon spathula]
MQSTGDIILAFISGALLVFGVLWNLFNLAITIHLQRKSRSYQTLEFIISCTTLSNLLLDLSTICTVYFYEFKIFCTTEMGRVIPVVFFILFSASASSFWSIAWLCVFYCVKIISLPTALFIKLKRNIALVVNWALILTVFFCFVLFCPFLSLIPIMPANATANNTYNINNTLGMPCTSPRFDFPETFASELYFVIFVLFLCPIPLIIMVTTSSQLVVHLCKHTQQMKRNQNEFQSRNSYLLICKMIISLVVVYLFTIMLAFIYLLTQAKDEKMSNDFLVLDMAFYCAATGVLLTATNKNLKKKLASLFCCGKIQRQSEPK